MKVGRTLALAAVCFAASACYHQVVQSGRAPGTTVVDKPWAPSFIFGLVPPPDIDVTQTCGRNGVAVVETQQSAPNWLRGALTLGTFTPISVKVTCASGTASIPGASTMVVAQNASQSEREAGVAAAR